MRHRRPCFVLLGAILLTTSCSSSEYLITSDPKGAVVEIDGEEAGVTPLQTDLGLDETHTIVVRSASGSGRSQPGLTKRVTPSPYGGVLEFDLRSASGGAGASAVPAVRGGGQPR